VLTYTYTYVEMAISGSKSITSDDKKERSVRNHMGLKRDSKYRQSVLREIMQQSKDPLKKGENDLV
jgi:hypothetical protein